MQGQKCLHPYVSHHVSFVPLSHCSESTAERGQIDHSCLVGGSFLVILAMIMTVTINSNNVLLIRVTSAGQHGRFEHVHNFCVSNANTFHSWLCTLKMCSFLLCRTPYLLYSVRSYYIVTVFWLF